MRTFDREYWLDTRNYGYTAEHLRSVCKMSHDIDSVWWNYWEKNADKNWQLAESGSWIDEDYGKFGGHNLSAVICGSGPSLKENISHLRELSKANHFIIAVDNALKTLSRHGIIPHLTVTSDHQACVQKMFETVTDKHTVVVSLTTHPETVAKLTKAKAKVIWFGSLNPFSSWWQLAYKNYSRRIATCRPGYVVTTIAVDMAYWMGFQNIILLGNDFCYRDKKACRANAARDEDVISVRDIVIKNFLAWREQELDGEQEALTEMWDEYRGVSAPRFSCDDRQSAMAQHEMFHMDDLYTIPAFQKAAGMLSFFPSRHTDCRWIYINSGLHIPGWERRKFQNVVLHLATPSNIVPIRSKLYDPRRNNIQNAASSSGGHGRILHG